MRFRNKHIVFSILLLLVFVSGTLVKDAHYLVDAHLDAHTCEHQDHPHFHHADDSEHCDFCQLLLSHFIPSIKLFVFLETSYPNTRPLLALSQVFLSAQIPSISLRAPPML